MEGKQLNLNAPLLSVRRFSAPPPPPPSSSLSNTAPAGASSRVEGGGRTVAGQGPRRYSLPSYKSDLKSGPVGKPGLVPFFWEQSPGLPRDGSAPSGAPAKAVGGPLVAPKLPPGRILRRLTDENEEPISMGAFNSANNGVLPRGAPPLSSASTSPARTASTNTATSLKTKPLTEEPPVLEEQPSSSDERDEEEDAFSDALDRLSCTDSCFMNCSISGLSEPSGRFSTDPEVRDFMMGRFLPAAQAMATGSPQYASRKSSVPSRETARRVVENVGERGPPAAPLPYQHRADFALRYQMKVGNSDNGEDDDDEEYEDVGNLSMKGCGFLRGVCLKSSFCLLNPVPGLKVGGRMPVPAARRLLSPQVRASHHHGSPGHGEDENTWEEVYKHKLGRVNQTLGEETSKLTSESNQLSYWSDSQTADGSSSCPRSMGGGVSPCRNDMSCSPLHEGKVSAGVSSRETRIGEDDDAFESCSKDGEKYWEIAPHPSSRQTSGSLSPVIEKTVYVDSVQPQKDTSSKSSLSVAKGARNYAGKDFEVLGESQRIDRSLMLEACEDNMSPHKATAVVDAGALCSAKGSGALKSMDNAEDHVLDGPQHWETEDEKNDPNALQALLPPPLPKSPSESWLSRTLPSVASRDSNPMPFLGIQYPKKQVIQASSTRPKWETMVKKRVLPKGQMRFADVLARPANDD